MTNDVVLEIVKVKTYSRTKLTKKLLLLRPKQNLIFNFYMKNQRSVPLITGSVIPERAFSFADYEKNILQAMVEWNLDPWAIDLFLYQPGNLTSPHSASEEPANTGGVAHNDS